MFYPPLRDEFTKFGDKFEKIAHNDANGIYCYKRTTSDGLTYYEAFKAPEAKDEDGTPTNAIRVLPTSVLARPYVSGVTKGTPLTKSHSIWPTVSRRGGSVHDWPTGANNPRNNHFSTNKTTMKQIKIDNQHGIGLTLDRVTTTIVDSNGTHRGDDEIILYVPDASDYDTDFIQGNCAMLCFSPAQAIRLARRLLRLAGKAKKNIGGSTPPMPNPKS